MASADQKVAAAEKARVALILGGHYRSIIGHLKSPGQIPEAFEWPFVYWASRIGAVELLEFLLLQQRQRNESCPVQWVTDTLLKYSTDKGHIPRWMLPHIMVTSTRFGGGRPFSPMSWFPQPPIAW
jgi:hypothetical protein